MNLTLWNWIFLVVFLLGAMALAVFVPDTKKQRLIATGVAIVLTLALGMGFSWYNTNTASGIRNYKDYQSELSNGIEREITITAEDGRQIYYYKGRFDVESDHEDNYIKFEREDGMREIIYYGITDTVIITEVAE